MVSKDSLHRCQEVVLLAIADRLGAAALSSAGDPGNAEGSCVGADRVHYPPAVDAPDGFDELSTSAFSERVGPLYINRTAKTPTVGLIVCDHHTNSMGRAHGGMLVTLADVAIGQAVRSIVEQLDGAVTLDMHSSFLSTARVGEWLEARATIEQQARSVVFATCSIVVGRRKVATISETLSIRSTS
jgi:uncharacterized protein (TIGR00369 family)